MTMPENFTWCQFCQIVTGKEPANVVYRGDDVWVFHPLNPVVEGHLLVVPVNHCRDYTDDPATTAKVMEVAARFGNVHSNLITSAGEYATQTVYHLHVHIVPREEGDDFKLPWSRTDERDITNGYNIARMELTNYIQGELNSPASVDAERERNGFRAVLRKIDQMAFPGDSKVYNERRTYEQTRGQDEALRDVIELINDHIARLNDDNERNSKLLLKVIRNSVAEMKVWTR